MRIFFAMTGQLWYGGVIQQSILLIRHLRRLGCQVLPFAAVAPPHNDEIPPELLDYELGFNVGDYALRQKPFPLRWLAGLSVLYCELLSWWWRCERGGTVGAGDGRANNLEFRLMTGVGLAKSPRFQRWSS